MKLLQKAKNLPFSFAYLCLGILLLFCGILSGILYHRFWPLVFSALFFFWMSWILRKREDGELSSGEKIHWIIAAVGTIFSFGGMQLENPGVTIIGLILMLIVMSIAIFKDMFA